LGCEDSLSTQNKNTQLKRSSYARMGAGVSIAANTAKAVASAYESVI